MKKTMKKLVAAILSAAVLLTAVPQPTEVAHAATEAPVLVQETKSANYKALYKKFLATGKGKSKYGTFKIGWYYMLNVNRSGTPELVVVGDGSGGAVVTYYVYTIKKNKVVQCGEYNAKGVSGVKPTFKYSKKYKGLVGDGWTNYIGGVWSNLYQVSGAKLVHKYHAREALNPKAVYYTGTTDTKCKKVSKSSYQKFYKKYFGSLKTYKMKKNTASNRNAAFK